MEDQRPQETAIVLDALTLVVAEIRGALETLVRLAIRVHRATPAPHLLH
jgi:hypothetical protein